jgi:hypothetical protein
MSLRGDTQAAVIRDKVVSSSPLKIGYEESVSTAGGVWIDSKPCRLVTFQAVTWTFPRYQH